MNRSLVCWGSRTVGVVATAMLALAVPRAQEKQAPAAPYEEVKPWGPSVKGEFNWEPAGAETDKQGHVYFLRRSDPAVWVMDSNGKVIRSFGNGMFVWAHGMHVDRQGNIWATDCAIGPSAG